MAVLKLQSVLTDPVLHEVFKFIGTIFKANPYEVLNRSVFRSEFIMTAHLAVSEYADMILMSEINEAPQAYELIKVLPRDEMIGEALCDEK
jgi:hypothetical protein